MTRIGWQGGLVARLLVLMITVVVVDQMLRRQSNSRIRAVPVQAAIMMTHSNRASRAMSRVLARSGDRDVAYKSSGCTQSCCCPPRRY